jgi:hypothetical protein
MLRRPHFRLALLGFVLLIGQLLHVAHAYEHEALAVDAVCSICIHGHGLDPCAVAPSTLALPEFGAPAPTAMAPPIAHVTRRTAAHRSRGPPSS